MKLYISTTGVDRVTISNMKGRKLSGFGRSFSIRMVMFPIAILIGIVLPILFIRSALLVMESAALCSSSIGCMTWRIFGGTDDLLREELVKALIEATSSDNEDSDEVGFGTIEEGKNLGPFSFTDLVKDMASNRQDIKAFAFKTKAMITKMEHIVERAKYQESIHWHLAAHGVPKSLYCLSLKLVEEYAVNSVARSRLPLPEHVYRLTDPSFHHIVLLTDHVLAASVVISSTIESSTNPQKLVFHVITDKKTYTSMHSWFALNTIHSAVVEVKGLHQYDWSNEVNVGVKEMLDIHHQIWNHKYTNLKKEDFAYEADCDHKLDVLSPSSISLLNHLRIYLPELFPDLDRIVFLDDDVVVQQDLSYLWELDLDEKVVGAVTDSWRGLDCCPGRKYKDYFNFTHPIISSNFDEDQCGWLFGMNIFDLERWRATNITYVYHQWLQHNLKSNFSLWHAGALPPALIAFQNHVHYLNPTWHLTGLGARYPQINRQNIEEAAVIHFSGLAKPWLEIGSPEVRGLWKRHVNLSNEHVRKCGING